MLIEYQKGRICASFQLRAFSSGDLENKSKLVESQFESITDNEGKKIDLSICNKSPCYCLAVVNI